MKQFFSILLIAIIASCTICLFIKNNKSVEIYNNTKIDSIKVINDSIHDIIRESTVKIQKINSDYAQKIYVIDTQSVNDDIKLFTEYVSQDSL